MLHDENAFGSSGNAEIAKQAPSFGLEVVATESYKTNDTDMTAQLTKIKGANPEVLIVWGTNPGPALAAKNMKQLGMTIPYVGSHGIANQTFIKLAGDAAEGVVFPAGRLLVPSSITDSKPESGHRQVHQRLSVGRTAPRPTRSRVMRSRPSPSWPTRSTGRAARTPLPSRPLSTPPPGSPVRTALQLLARPTTTDWWPSDMIMVRIQGGTWVLAE